MKNVNRLEPSLHSPSLYFHALNRRKLTYQLIVQLSVPTYNAIQLQKAVHLVEWKADSEKRTNHQSDHLSTFLLLAD